MKHELVIANLEKLAACIKKHQDRVKTLLSFLELPVAGERWYALGQEETMSVFGFVGIDNINVMVFCRAVTLKGRTRFCFHMQDTSCIEAQAYVACGYMLNEKTFPVVVAPVYTNIKTPVEHRTSVFQLLEEAKQRKLQSILPQHTTQCPVLIGRNPLALTTA